MRLGLLTKYKNEYFTEEFITYYLNEGVDHIYIIDDNNYSLEDDNIYNKIITHRQNVHIIYNSDPDIDPDINPDININTSDKNHIQKVYNNIRSEFDWLIHVDINEFITTKRNGNRTIKEELEITFKDVHYIKVPYVMMSSNGINKSPKSILETNVYRWDHNIKHLNSVTNNKKFRCRYDQIETKAIFQPKYFDNISDYGPSKPIYRVMMVDSIDANPFHETIFYESLREDSIKKGYLLCYHYGIISREDCVKRFNSDKSSFSLEEMLSSDYNEIFDKTLRIKTVKSKLKFIHITKTAGTSIENIGKIHGMQWGRFSIQFSRDGTAQISNDYWHHPYSFYSIKPYDKTIKLFTVVRNPYSRVLSECFCRWGGIKYDSKEDMNIYIQFRLNKIKMKDYELNHFLPQYMYVYDDDGKQIVHHVIRFEKLETEFENLMKQYGLSIKLDVRTMTNKKKYSIDDFTDETMQLINEVYKKDFLLFNYQMK